MPAKVTLDGEGRIFAAGERFLDDLTWALTAIRNALMGRPRWI